MGVVFELKGGLIYNKQLWAITCGTFLSTSVETARRQLQKAKAQILAGITYYQPFTEESGKKLQSSLDAKIHSFVVTIAKQMNLDALQAWDLVVFYLEHEFRGSEDNFESFLEADSRKEQLIKDICSFYWSERAFLLKCVGIYLAYWQEEDHPFSGAFSELISELTPSSILKSLLKQLDQLSNQDVPTLPSNIKSSASSKNVSSVTTDQWIAINLREQLAVIHNLTLFTNGYSIEWEKVLRTHELCKRSLPYRHRLKKQHLPIVYSVTCSEVILLLRMMDVSDLNFAKTLWLSDDTKLFEALDAELQEFYRKEEHGPLLLAWMLFNFMGPDGDKTFSRYRKFGVMATKLGVFAFLEKLLLEPMFKSETTKIADIAYETIYSLIDTLATNFEPVQLQPREQLLSLCSTLLAHSTIADRFWQSPPDSGVRLILQVALKRFPLEFEPLVNIVTSLASANSDSCKQVMQMLTGMNFLAEPIVPALLPMLTRLTDTSHGVRLNMQHKPLPFVDSISLRPGTLGTLEEGTPQFITWNFQYNFWLAIHNAEAHLINQISQSTAAGVEPSIVSRALVSVCCIAACLESGCEIEPAMVLPIEMVFTIMERFLLVSNPKSAIMAACLDVASCLVSTFPSDVTNKLRALDFLPTIQPDEGTVMTHASFARGHFFNAGVLGRLVVNEERPVGSFLLVRAYLRFLRNLISTSCEEKEQQAMALSGLVYVILEVFPRCYDWGYAVPMERTQLGDLCLQLFHRLLNPAVLRSESKNAPSSDFERLLARTCLYAMLYSDNGHTMLRISATGEAELKARMLEQTSWISGEGVELVALVHLALSILNRVLLHKDTIKTSKELSPTEQLIYASPSAKNSIQVVPNIAYYVYHCFNPRLPILAVKLLKRIALEMPMTLKACLAMDGDVIREAFVAKLDSPQHSVQLKVAILELITACIHTQPGATEAFFNIHHPEESKRLFSKDKSPNEEPSGCLTYACSLLARAKDEPALVRSELYGPVVELLYALWMHHQKILLSFLRSKENFWRDLCAPLFLPPSHSVRGYAQVFNILSSEMYTFGTSVHAQLMEQLKKLFSDKDTYLETWSKFVTHSLCMDSSGSNQFSMATNQHDESSECISEDIVRERLALMTAWKDLLLVVLGEFRSTSDLVVSERQQGALAGHVLLALEQESTQDEGNCPKLPLRAISITMLAELLLVLQARWKSSCFSQPENAVSQLHTVLLRFSYVYHDMPPRTRTALLGCGTHAVQLLQASIHKDEVAMELLVRATVTMVSYELQALSIGNETKTNETPSTLSITLLQALCVALSKASQGSWEMLLRQSKIVALITTSLSQALHSHTHLQFAQSALHLLLSLAGSERNAYLLNLTLLQDQIWLQLTPKTHMQCNNQPFQMQESWVDSEWSSVFCVGLDLVRTLLEQDGVRVLEAVINFSAVQEAALIDCLLLARHSLKPSSLALTEATLKLMSQLVRHASQWRPLAFRTYCNLMRAVSLCLDLCVGLLTRPHLISAMAEGGAKQRTSHSESLDCSVKVTPKLTACSNRLVNVLVLSMTVLHQLSPGVAPLLCDRELDVEAWPLLLEPSWSAPAQPGHRQSMNSLTLGTLLAAINVFSFSAANSRHARSPLARGARSLLSAPSPGKFASTAGTSPDPESNELSGTTAWLRSLDFDRAQMALQVSLSLLASQGLLLIRSRDPRDNSLLRREISTEMSQFVELMRRTFGENLEAGKDPTPVADVTPPRPHDGRTSVVRTLLQETSAPATSTPVRKSSEPVIPSPSTKNVIYECSNSDYLRLMAQVFQCVFRE